MLNTPHPMQIVLHELTVFLSSNNNDTVYLILYVYLHCALASGAVYCNRSCVCVWVFVAGGRCPNLTTASTRTVFASL